MEDTTDVKRQLSYLLQNLLSTPWKHEQYFKTEQVLQVDGKTWPCWWEGKFSWRFQGGEGFILHYLGAVEA